MHHRPGGRRRRTLPDRTWPCESTAAASLRWSTAWAPSRRGTRRPACRPCSRPASRSIALAAGRIWQFPVVARRLRRLLAAQKPQIVQTFLFHANIVGRIAARRAGVKAVVAGIRVAERAARWHLWLDRLTQRWVDRYVCVSRAVADFSAARAVLPPEKLVVIPNGIDLDKYPARQPADLAALGIAAGRRAVTFVGRLEPQKGVDWLIETAPRWLAKLPDCDLLLVGEGPLRGPLEAAVPGGRHRRAGAFRRLAARRAGNPGRQRPPGPAVGLGGHAQCRAGGHGQPPAGGGHGRRGRTGIARPGAARQTVRYRRYARCLWRQNRWT